MNAAEPARGSRSQNQFARNVALSGDTALITGELGTNGAGFVFIRTSAVP